MFVEVLQFRQRMAQHGFEYTPQEAHKILQKTQCLQQQIEQIRQLNPQYFQLLQALSLPEKMQILQLFREQGVELTLPELNDAIQLLIDA